MPPYKGVLVWRLKLEYNLLSGVLLTLGELLQRTSSVNDLMITVTQCLPIQDFPPANGNPNSSGDLMKFIN